MVPCPRAAYLIIAPDVSLTLRSMVLMNLGPANANALAATGATPGLGFSEGAAGPLANFTALLWFFSGDRWAGVAVCTLRVTLRLRGTGAHACARVRVCVRARVCVCVRACVCAPPPFLQTPH